MAHLLIWGETREILAGELPASPPAEEVRSLAALQAALDGRGAALVLADPRCLEAERDEIEAWLRGGGSAQVVLVAVADPAEGDEVLRRFPFVDDLLLRPVTPVRLRRKLERAIEAVRSRRVIRQLEKALQPQGRRAQPAQRDRGGALRRARHRQAARADPEQEPRDHRGGRGQPLPRRAREGAGQRERRPAALQARPERLAWSCPSRSSRSPSTRPRSPGYVALSGRVGERGRRLPPPGGLALHASAAPSTRSRATAPSRCWSCPCSDHQDARDRRRPAHQQEARPRSGAPAGLARRGRRSSRSPRWTRSSRSSLASQAAVAFENADLIQRIRRLFDEFVHAAVSAVEQRDPTDLGPLRPGGGAHRRPRREGRRGVLGALRRRRA